MQTKNRNDTWLCVLYLLMVATMIFFGLKMTRDGHRINSMEFIGIMVGVFVFFGSIIASYSGKKVELSNDGIFVKSKLVPWSEIFCVDVASAFCFCFYYYTAKGHKCYRISWTWKTLPIYIECLKYAALKIPPDIFTDDAKRVLTNIGAWNNELTDEKNVDT